MYDRASSDRTASRLPDLPGPSPDEAARQALGRVRKALTDFLPGMHLDADRLRAALITPFTETSEETDRLFALGWLHWLAGDSVAAEPLLAEAAARFQKDGEKEKLAETAYWLARIRVGLGRGD